MSAPRLPDQPAGGKRFRIVVFGEPRTPWRESRQEAIDDAIAAKLATWDGSKREWFLAVPVAIQSERSNNG